MKPGTSRLEAFSDGVFAVAITLLVLQLTVPEVASGHLLTALLQQWPLLATYCASFLTIGVIWVNHHSVFSYLERADRTLQFLNLLLLLCVVLIPYPTSLLGRYLLAGHDAQVAGAAYGLVMTLMGVAFAALWGYATGRSGLLRAGVDVARARQTRLRFGLGNLVYAASIGLAWLSPLLVVLLYLVTAIYYAFDQIPLAGPDEDVR